MPQEMKVRGELKVRVGASQETRESHEEQWASMELQSAGDLLRNVQSRCACVAVCLSLSFHSSVQSP